jgi:DNA primase
MRNFAKRIVLAYDADSAGQSAAASVYQWERQHEVDVFVAKLPKGSDPAELAHSEPAALASAISSAVPFLQFRLDRVLDAANLTTVEGRARNAEAALRVLAEHPSDLVRDQYLLKVADALRLDLATLRPRVSELVGNPQAKAVVVDRPLQPRVSEPLPRPGLEALRLSLHFPHDVKDRFIAEYFVNEVQREIFLGLSTGQSVSEVVDHLRRQGEDGAADVLSELSVDEFDREYTVNDVTAVVAQMLRSAVTAQLRDVERELRNSEITPDVAIATIRDVKERLEMLDGPQGSVAEADLRAWLLARSANRA